MFFNLGKDNDDFKRILRESAQEDNTDLSGYSNDEIKEKILKKAGVNLGLLKNPVSRKVLFDKIDRMYPFRIENKITVDESWKKFYGKQYKDIPLVDLFVRKIKGESIECSSEYEKWNILQDGSVELSRTTEQTNDEQNDFYSANDTVTYSVKDKMLIISDIHEHTHLRKNKSDRDFSIGEKFINKNITEYNMQGIQLKWENEKESHKSSNFEWKGGTYYDYTEKLDKSTEYSIRKITVSRDSNDLSKAIVESMDSPKIEIDLTKDGIEDISTLNATREIVNNNYIDNGLRLNKNENLKDRNDRLTKKINNSYYKKGCIDYSNTQKGERI